MDPKKIATLRQIRSLLETLDTEADPGPVFRDALGQYEAARVPELAATTRRQYLHHGSQLRRTTLADLRMGEIETPAVLAAVTISNGVAGARVLAKHVGRVFTWSAEVGIFTGPNPAEGIRAYKAPVPDECLDADEIRRLIAALHDPEVGELWKRRTVFFLALQPWRSSEALNLCAEHIRGGVAHLHTKSGPRSLVLSTPALELVGRALEGRRRGLVFRPQVLSLANAQDQVRRVARKAVEQAGVSMRRLHALRHSGATNLQALGVPLADIGALLGHRSVLSTARYIHSSPRRQHAAIEQLGMALARTEDA
jgi:integrase